MVFYHDLSTGEGDPLAWHAGCAVAEGVKWTLQKFKETPGALRVRRKGAKRSRKKRKKQEKEKERKKTKG